jgi:hypothetical protein
MDFKEDLPSPLVGRSALQERAPARLGQMKTLNGEPLQRGQSRSLVGCPFEKFQGMAGSGVPAECSRKAGRRME